MSTEQFFLRHFPLEQLSSGAEPAYTPAEYGMEWGTYGPSTVRQASASDSKASTEARHNYSLFDFRPAPEARPASAPDMSCLNVGVLDVGVMFDVCVPKDRSGPQKAGGDFADVVPLHGDWVALFLGDAAGQGAAAALAVPQALYSLRQLLSETADTCGNYPLDFKWDPGRILKRLNRHLCGPALPAACASVSLSLVVLNTQTGQTLCACAGSEPPLILRARGPIETVSAGRVALGVEADRSYRSVDFLLAKGDALLLATDGITKAQKTGNGTKSTLHYEGLTKLALEAFGLGGSPGRMARTVLSGARAFAGGSFHDHASVLVASRR